MIKYGLSVCVFIRDCFRGAFCLFESMASLLPFADEFVVMDLGSTDGTLEVLREITEANDKFKLIVRDGFPKIDAGVFADLANELVDFCQHDRVLYYQADEVWHENLLRLMKARFDAGEFDLSFWRIQYRENFQLVKWFPHLVHRVGYKNKFHFVGDGMNSDRVFDARVCSNYGAEYFQQWGTMGQDGIKPYTDEMILDVSLVGGFRDNIIERRQLHAAFWHEEPTIEDKPADIWKQSEYANPNWVRKTSPYDIPQVMRWHVGKVRYELRPELLEAIKTGNVWQIVGLDRF